MQVKGGPHSFMVYSFAHSGRQESPRAACFTMWCFALPLVQLLFPSLRPRRFPIG